MSWSECCHNRHQFRNVRYVTYVRLAGPHAQLRCVTWPSSLSLRVGKGWSHQLPLSPGSSRIPRFRATTVKWGCCPVRRSAVSRQALPYSIPQRNFARLPISMKAWRYRCDEPPCSGSHHRFRVASQCLRLRRLLRWSRCVSWTLLTCGLRRDRMHQRRSQERQPAGSCRAPGRPV